ncbi:MAG: baseplate J/gp47 family protein [Leclercia adecarboxylata]|nr:baseplate J/gp47 family protein [Leclercia adecarboxylata]
MADSNFYRPPLTDLITQLRNDINSRFQQDDILRRTNAEVYSRAVAAAVNSLYGYLDYLAKNMLPDLADEIWLPRHGNLKKCQRKQATAAAGWARWDGVGEVGQIAAGVELQRDDQVTYVTTEAAAAAGDVLRVPVRCTTEGVAGNCDDGRALILVSPVSGLCSRAVADTITDGQDIEDFETWRARIIDRWYYVPQSGADPDYVVWAKNIAGISRAWTYRNMTGAGTVGVMIATADQVDPSPSEVQLQQVRDYIEPKSPVAGSRLSILGPTLKNIDFTILLYPDTAATRASVISEVQAFLQRDGNPQETIYLSRLNEAISVAAGESHHVLISPEADIRLGDKELPVTGAFKWTN